MELRKRGIFLVFGLLLLAGLCHGTSGRAALVLETKGNNSLLLDGKQVRMRTLQVLPMGVSVDVPKDCRLRLSYFKSGRKEKVIGPCSIKITRTASQKLDGSGRIEVQAKRNATTELKKEENLRRMGGELQASITNNPETTLARLVPPAAQPAVTNSNASLYQYKGTTRAPKPSRPFGFGPYFLSPADVATLHWTHGPSPTDITLKQGQTILAQVTAEERACAVDPELLKSGLQYTIELTQSQGKPRTIKFNVLSKDELREYHRIAYRIRDEEKKDRRSLLTQLIYLEMTMGLLNRAQRTALQACKEYPEDPGFHFTLAQIQLKLNKKSEAKKHLYRAKSLESFKAKPK